MGEVEVEAEPPEDEAGRSEHIGHANCDSRELLLHPKIPILDKVYISLSNRCAILTLLHMKLALDDHIVSSPNQPDTPPIIPFQTKHHLLSFFIMS